MRDRPVLFITPNFPPQGGIGVQRPVAFVKSLKKAGHTPIVFTVSEEDMRHSFGVSDKSRLGEIEELGIEVHRCATGKPYGRISKIMKLRLFRLFWFFFYHKYWDEYAYWPKNAEAKALELIRKHDIQVIYTCSGPFSALELAKNLKQKTGAKWVSDVRDPLTEHFNLKWPTRMHWKWVRKKENKLFPHADHTIVVTEEMKKIFMDRYGMNDSNLTVITNGF